MKVLHILQNDGELRPLIFEHEGLLRTLRDMRELKAEQMLAILTAAETEMYESSKKNDELQQQLMSTGKNAPAPTEHKGVSVELLSPNSQAQMQQELRQSRERADQSANEVQSLKQQHAAEMRQLEK